MASEKTQSGGSVAGAPPVQPAFFDRQVGPFFRRVDWLAFWTCFAVAFGVYFYTMAPTVTLEDSGELTVASDYLGVPHPPGYPIWTLVTWFFQWIFHWVKYYGQPESNFMLMVHSLRDLLDPSMTGHPNPAWSVGLCSAFFGALACALFSLVVSRSGADMIRGLRSEAEILGSRAETMICWVCGVTGGLLFAFSPVLWSQSTIVEVYALNAFFMVLVLLLMYRWMCRPREDATLYVTAFIFGLGLTNHQTLLFMMIALMAAIWFSDRRLFRDSLAGLFWLIAGLMFWKAYQANPASPEQMQSRQTQITVGLLCACAPLGLYLIQRKLMTEWKRFLLVVLLVGLGLSFYAYLPVSSEQNPPMNWGYPRTLDGFWHAISRGQYEKIDPFENLKTAIAQPSKFFSLCNDIITSPYGYISVVSQFTLLISLAALILVFFLPRMSRRSRDWLLVTLAAFLSLTVVFIIFQWPSPDVQTLFIGRVQYIQAHAIFALWISYGLIFGLVWLDAKLGQGSRGTTYAFAALVLLLPLIPFLKNYHDDAYVKLVGGAEQNEHDFGWQFGAWELEGSRAILAELPEEERATYPNPAYPPPMETNAVFFGGTDPGRFVPTYMIYSAHYREDVYLITQNALADNTYMNVMRDLYGDRIWIPGQQDSNLAFQKYVKDVQEGRIQAGAEVSIEGGRVSVQGVAGVMTINGILARAIFDYNKNRHAFYVEESYVIDWMYPFLEPHGLIMKINREQLPQLTPEVVKNDRDFWTWYTKRLMGNPLFLRDVVARKTFSKLRSAIAGIYVYRQMFDEAELAFRQSIELYPLSPEANFRLADAYMRQFRFADAGKLIEAFLKEDPGNDKVKDFLNQIRGLEQAQARRSELEQMLASGGDVNLALELADIYRKMNLGQLFQGLTMNIINQSNLPPQVVLRVAQMYGEMRNFEMLLYALQRYVEREPANPKGWIDLAAVQANLSRSNESLQSLRRAIDLGGEPVRDIVRKDPRFTPIRDTEAFRALVPPVQAGLDFPVNFPMGL